LSLRAHEAVSANVVRTRAWGSLDPSTDSAQRGRLAVVPSRRHSVWYAIAHDQRLDQSLQSASIWQLDADAVFGALTRKQRGMVLGVTLAMWVLTEETMLLIIAGARSTAFHERCPA